MPIDVTLLKSHPMQGSSLKSALFQLFPLLLLLLLLLLFIIIYYYFQQALWPGSDPYVCVAVDEEERKHPHWVVPFISFLYLEVAMTDETSSR